MTSLAADGLVAERGGRNVVDGVSLEVQSGQVVGLVGPTLSGLVQFGVPVLCDSTSRAVRAVSGRKAKTEVMDAGEVVSATVASAPLWRRPGDGLSGEELAQAAAGVVALEVRPKPQTERCERDEHD